MVIFIVGGTTYEESRCVALQNAMNTGIRFILGGSVILNSKRYVSGQLCQNTCIISEKEVYIAVLAAPNAWISNTVF